jgi:hypothetical protein
LPKENLFAAPRVYMADTIFWVRRHAYPECK